MNTDRLLKIHITAASGPVRWRFRNPFRKPWEWRPRIMHVGMHFIEAGESLDYGPLDWDRGIVLRDGTTVVGWRFESFLGQKKEPPK